ncbi:uncharacterized protein BDW43DRAFT_297701 [Aspergillus alliaceus]|uniref:uncharacterized protein n=1 Tax=Petromyces alliaceus TaxID=209559 RepID=UPI0012A3D762|nr:uncharacterized protein BDW43DRAFT_297701 [Aspergillus alliaceus]KAB8237367.1 hypothetical protein BDW43DRAFT_297701 [Aspergillus alliaceus]
MAEHELASIGKRLMVQVIDDLAKKDPQRKVCAVPKGSKIFGWTFEEVRDEIAFIARSSGTTVTGIPKPIQLTFGYFRALDAGAYIPVPEGRFAGVPDRLSKDDVPLSTEFLTSILSATKLTAVLLPPCNLEDMTLSQASMEACWNLKYVFWGGSSLSPEVGRKIRDHTSLSGFMGMTEAGFILALAPEEKEDWEYFEWWPTNGIEMELVDGNLYELVIHRHYDPFLHPVFHTFPDLSEYHTKDVYTRHLTKSELWKLRGRLDDVVSLSNGEKFNPVAIEKLIEGHALVARAVVVGNGRFQPALLVEPNWNQWGESSPAGDLIAHIWSTVQEANRINPAHGRIMENKIGLASKIKTFQTTPKGSTQRRLVTRDYEKEIEAIYTYQDDDTIRYQMPKSAEMSGIKEFVRNVVSDTLGFSSFSNQTDFYNLGLDSLQTMQLSWILHQFIYGIASNADQSTVLRSENINALVQKYTAGLLGRDPGTSETVDRHTVILTGSTGSLGNYLLHTPLNHSTFAKTKSFQEEKSQYDFNQERVEFLVASFGEVRLGISGPMCDEMLREDFNISVDSFEDVHIRGTRHIIEFSLQSEHNAHIYFMSSIGTIGEWKPTHGPSVPEMPLEDCDVTLRQGYVETKHICERNCTTTSQLAGIPTTILRLGQIAGPTTENGIWNRQEWLPLVATSKAMGKSLDTLATVITELIHTRSTIRADSRCSVFHLVNPLATSWESLLPSVQERYNVQPVEVSEWVNELEKLLTFYQGLVEGEGALSAPIEMEKSKEASTTMKSMKLIEVSNLHRHLQSLPTLPLPIHSFIMINGQLMP